MKQINKYKIKSSNWLYIPFIVILFNIYSCEVSPATNKMENSDVRLWPGSNRLKTVTIDSCEYIVYKGTNRFGITHKGNCKNDTHK